MVDIHPEHARAVLEALSIGIVLIDAGERVSWMNACAAKMLERDAEDVLGRGIGELPLPYTPVGTGADAVQVRVDGTVIGITQRYDSQAGGGTVLLALERGHALVWFLSALASGVPGTVAASGVLSRAAIINRLEAEVSRSRRYSNALSCVTIRCKPAVDDDLSATARLFKGQLRWVDLLGRWDDDVLLVVLPETEPDAARTIRDKLMAIQPAADEPGTLEFGVSSWRRGDSAEQLVRRALAGADPQPVAVKRRGAS